MMLFCLWTLRGTTPSLSISLLFLESVVDVDEFIGCFTKPDRYPHVEIGQPKNAKFGPYDLIILVYESISIRNLYAYQLKEEVKIPVRLSSKVKTEFDSYVLAKVNRNNED